jgi:paraquat-inducible protein B
VSTDSPRPGEEPPQPEVRRRAGPSLVWIVPLVVALVGGWLVYKTLSEKGPVVTISFKTAEGIEAGKTKVRYKNIEVGLVESVRFSDDFANVILRVEMAQDTEDFVGRGARFWVVRPQLSVRGVSGLSTLVSGAYIEVEPGQGAPQRHFEGLESPPVVRAEEAGTRVTLVSDRLGSLDSGSPVYYRGIVAGEVLGHELGSDQKSVLIFAFVRAPFDQLVRSNSRFWNVSGIDVDVSSEGITVRTESVQTVLFGGISFDTPESPEPAKSDLDGVIFTLHEDRASIGEQAFTQRLRFVLFFGGSVRGLSLGAPVEFKGIKVGQVVDVRLEFDPDDTSFRIPVLIEIEPERVISRNAARDQSPYEMLETLVSRGLRARLQTGSLLTGQLFVELDMHPNTPVTLVDAGAPYPELPTIPASLEEIERTVRSFLAKLDSVDLQGLSTELLATLQGTNALVNSAQVKGAMRDLEGSMSSLRSMLSKVDRRVEPMASNVDEAVSAGRATLAKLQVTLDLVNRVLESDSPLQYRAVEMAEELTETARAIRIFVDLLQRNPDAMIFGKPGPGGQ